MTGAVAQVNKPCSSRHVQVRAEHDLRQHLPLGQLCCDLGAPEITLKTSLRPMNQAYEDILRPVCTLRVDLMNLRSHPRPYRAHEARMARLPMPSH